MRVLFHANVSGSIRRSWLPAHFYETTVSVIWIIVPCRLVPVPFRRRVFYCRLLPFTGTQLFVCIILVILRFNLFLVPFRRRVFCCRLLTLTVKQLFVCVILYIVRCNLFSVPFRDKLFTADCLPSLLRNYSFV